ncbi:riboflavin kinase [Candidatus Parcubacteria bacterium]|nr:riboflavin kinase [Candidatus Parcubacteria bacterium]
MARKNFTENYFSFNTKAVKGEGIGKKIGFPTINLDKISLKINYGVYLVEADIDNKIYKGLLHFGPKKTFANNISLELLLKNFIFDISNKPIKIAIIKRIRNIKKFTNIKDLQSQIKQDVDCLCEE